MHKALNDKMLPTTSETGEKMEGKYQDRYIIKRIKEKIGMLVQTTYVEYAKIYLTEARKRGSTGPMNK